MRTLVVILLFPMFLAAQPGAFYFGQAEEDTTTYHPTLEAVLDRADLEGYATPTSSQLLVLDSMCRNPAFAAVLDSADFVFVFWHGLDSLAKINWAQPDSALAVNQDIEYTTSRGAKAVQFALSPAFLTNWKMTANMELADANNIGMFAYVDTVSDVTASSYGLMGVDDSSASEDFWMRNEPSGSYFRFRIGRNSFTSYTNDEGLIAMARTPTTGTQVDTYYKGTTGANSNNTRTMSNTAEEFYVLAVNGSAGTWFDGYVLFAGLGAGKTVYDNFAGLDALGDWMLTQ